MLTIAIVGLPNVGKSTLFNRLVGRKIAMVNDIPGVTRDRREAIGRISDSYFRIIDTGGLDTSGTFFRSVNEQVKFAVEISDVVFFTVDSKSEISPQNLDFAKWIRQIANKRPVILIANKSESKKTSRQIEEFEYLNFIGPVYISAEHNLGMLDLYDTLRPFFLESTNTEDSQHNPERIKIAIVGRPNVGKSTLINKLLSQNRMIISPEAGTTRDSIDTTYFYQEQEILLIDTAGIRKKASVVDNLEILSVKDSIDSIRRSNISVLVVDATIGLDSQDLSIAGIAIDEGKGLLVILNKWDLISKSAQQSLMKTIEKDQLSKIWIDVQMMPISALKDEDCSKVIDTCIKLNSNLRIKISTSKLNKWLILATENHKPPHYKGRQIRLKYITQTGTLPPSFIVMCNLPDHLDKTYIQYLNANFKKHFNLLGVPIKFNFKKTENKYVSK